MADRFDIIAKIAGKTEGRTQSDNPKDTIKLELEESDGKKFTWTSFHVNEFQPLKIGSVHRFTVSRPPNKDSTYKPYRNLEGYGGPAEMPASGEMTSLGQGIPTDTAGPTTGPGRTADGPSSLDRWNEQVSTESQGSVSTILRMIESGMTVEQAEANLDKVLELALKVERHHAGALQRRPTPEAVVDNAPVESPSANGAAPKPHVDVDGIDKVENLGQFLTLCRKRYPAHEDTLRKDIEAALHMVLDDITDYNDAWAQLGAHWDDFLAPAETST